MDSNRPQDCDNQVALGFPLHIETWLAGAAPLNSFSAERLTKSAKLHRSKVAPTLTLPRAAFGNAFGSPKDDLRDRTKRRRVVGLNQLSRHLFMRENAS
jgi:hypothetical protein